MNAREGEELWKLMDSVGTGTSGDKLAMVKLRLDMRPIRGGSETATHSRSGAVGNQANYFDHLIVSERNYMMGLAGLSDPMGHFQSCV